MAYEFLLVAALLFAATFVFVALAGSAVVAPKRYFLQLFLLLVTGVYFVGFWVRGGQTLAMKTWRMRVRMAGGDFLNIKTAMARFLLASAGLAFFGAGWWWMLFDRDRCPLHDRLTGTRVVLESSV